MRVRMRVRASVRTEDAEGGDRRQKQVKSEGRSHELVETRARAREIGDVIGGVR